MTSALDIMRLTPSEYNTATPPNWRWERARYFREHGKYLRRGQDDQWVTVAVKFQRELAKAASLAAHDRLLKKFPAIYWAWSIYDQPHRDTRWAIEAYLCAGADVASIADRVSQHHRTVQAYASLFFDVIGKTGHRLYMMNEVIGRSVNVTVHHGMRENQFDLFWKLLGLLKGPLLLDVVIAGDNDPGMVTNHNQASKSMHGLIRSKAEYQMWKAISTIPLSYNQEIIFGLFTKLKEIEEKSDSPKSAAGLIMNNIQATMASIGFEFGRPPRLPGAEAAAAARYDDCGAEPRAGELFQLAMGETLGSQNELQTIKFPEVKDGQPNQPGS